MTRASDIREDLRLHRGPTVRPTWADIGARVLTFLSTAYVVSAVLRGWNPW